MTCIHARWYGAESSTALCDLAHVEVKSTNEHLKNLAISCPNSNRCPIGYQDREGVMWFTTEPNKTCLILIETKSGDTFVEAFSGNFFIVKFDAEENRYLTCDCGRGLCEATIKKWTYIPGDNGKGDPS